MAASQSADISSSRAYQDKLRGLLGDQNPIDVLARMPDFIDRVVREHSPAQLRTRPYEGKWTPLEIIGHLIDAEFVYGYRVRLIFCEERPTILSMEQDPWVAGQRYNEDDPAMLAEDFRALRGTSVRLWRKVGPAALNRVGVHEERGEESLSLMLAMHAGHDLSHIDQLTRYTAAVRAR